MIPPRSQPIQPFMSRVEHSEDVALIIKIFAIVSAQCTKNKNICSPRVFEGNELKLMSSDYGVLVRKKSGDSFCAMLLHTHYTWVQEQSTVVRGPEVDNFVIVLMITIK